MKPEWQWTTLCSPEQVLERKALVESTSPAAHFGFS
jgi:hypothetical protein